MKFTQKPLDEQVMVLTGASSGIGLATAQMAAKRGAKLVLAARSGETLNDIAREIEQAGGEAVSTAVDVADREAVERIAGAAITRFGRIDTWVNNAGLSVSGRIEQVPIKDHRQLFEVNFWGTVYGSLTAVSHMKTDGGTLINVGSVASEVAFPLQGMYSASKHAIKGFTDALRMELQEEGAPVQVTLIKPAAIDTPFPQHAKNYTDREPKLPPPVYPPEEVAAAILHSACHPERDVYVGGIGPVISGLNRHMPRVMDRFSEKVLLPQQLRQEAARDRKGTLYRGNGGRVHGDHPGYVHKTSPYTRAATHPLAAGALVAAAGVAAAYLLAGSNPRQS